MTDRKFVDLVLVRVAQNQPDVLAVAPAWSHMPEGQVVMMEDGADMQLRGCVVTSRTVATDNDEYSFALAVAGQEPRRIMTLVHYEDVDWGEGDGDGD